MKLSIFPLEFLIFLVKISRLKMGTFQGVEAYQAPPPPRGVNVALRRTQVSSGLSLSEPKINNNSVLNLFFFLLFVGASERSTLIRAPGGSLCATRSLRCCLSYQVFGKWLCIFLRPFLVHFCKLNRHGDKILIIEFSPSFNLLCSMGMEILKNDSILKIGNINRSTCTRPWTRLHLS